jgi:hypothetical protein
MLINSSGNSLFYGDVETNTKFKTNNWEIEED